MIKVRGNLITDAGSVLCVTVSRVYRSTNSGPIYIHLQGHTHNTTRNFLWCLPFWRLPLFFFFVIPMKWRWICQQYFASVILIQLQNNSLKSPSSKPQWTHCHDGEINQRWPRHSSQFLWPLSLWWLRTHYLGTQGENDTQVTILSFVDYLRYYYALPSRSLYLSVCSFCSNEALLCSEQ